ncbi:hypothetical protein N9N26_01185 [Candidatus Poseidoniales archaeon]|jgi:hypothetical protein|nr:hypothetical protein [Candidatus Poseidoniales archaeon]
MKWGIAVPEYAGLIDGLSNQDSMRLQNLPIKVDPDDGLGKVWFYGPGGRKRLQAIFDYYNLGEIPPGEMLQTFTTKVGAFSVADMQRTIANLRGPNDDGYYHGRCPSCKEKGEAVGQVWDDTGDHFYANPDTGAIGCFSGCKKNELIASVTKVPEETAVVSPNTSGVSQVSEHPVLLAAEVRARISGNNVLCESMNKEGESAGHFKVPVPEVERFARAIAAMSVERFTIRELVESMGMDWTEIQGNRSVTKLVHPPVKALYGLGEINYYKDGQIELR